MARPRPRPSAKTIQIPAPVGGINTAAAGIAMPPGDCISAVNVVAAENGLRVRYGEREHVTGIVGSTDNVVRCIIPFVGSAGERLFCTTTLGIYDVTDQGDSPPLVLNFGTTLGNAGYGVFCTVVTAAGHYLLYADEENGLYRYAEGGATWTKVTSGVGAGQISGVDPARVASVVVFKSRVWMVEKDTDSAWYLPAGAISGVATEYAMGMRFAHGGSLVGLYSWTYDGGAGVDDLLVALATGGDVLIFSGTDPASASTFGLNGVWYAGPPPAGRRVATDLGGELLLITRKGLLPLSRLVVKVPDLQQETTTAKIANLINTLMGTLADARGWQIVQHPEDSTTLLLVPQGSGDYYQQLAQSAATGGWFLHRGLDMTCADVFSRRLYYGTDDGRVCVNTGTLDGIVNADPNAFTPIDWSLLTAASDLGQPVQKQVGLIRPLILSDGAIPSFDTNARYGYSQTELDPVSLVLSTADNVWNTGLWDESLWGGAVDPVQSSRGATGMGTAVSIAIRGSATTRTVLVAIDVTFTTGGFL